MYTIIPTDTVNTTTYTVHAWHLFLCCRATVVKSKREFLDEMYLPLKCVHPPKPASDDSCARGFYYIPDSNASKVLNKYS